MDGYVELPEVVTFENFSETNIVDYSMKKINKEPTGLPANQIPMYLQDEH